MERRVKQEIGISVLLMAISVFVIFVVSGYEDPMKEQYKTLRSAFVPILWASLLGLLSLIHALALFVKGSRPKDEKESPDVPEAQMCEPVSLSYADRRKVGVMVAVTAAAMIVYCLLLLKINFIVNNLWLLFVTMYAYGERSLKRTFLIAVLGSLGLWIMFVKVMQVPL